ncbi:MAG TPA: hypothetical protein ENI67_04740 [Gammaproteobacteria bacterium]|nr:hypothetical protein [Gammaproteobacteria bacterium]
MSNPDEAEAQGKQTFEQQVGAVVGKLTQDDKGVWQFPESVEAADEVKFAAMTEKRRRDTESALSKTRHELKAEKVLRGELEKRVMAPVEIDEATRAELDIMKLEDPEAWRKKYNELEQQANTKLQEELTAITTNAAQQAEISRRTEVLNQFNSAHPTAQITDQTLQDEIPPRISGKLAKGIISFEEFLVEAHDYLVAPKIVGGQELAAQPNLGSAGGGSDASNEAIEVQEITDYAKTVF